MDDFLTTKQLVKQTKVPRETIWSWVRGGYISKPKVVRVPKGRGRRALWPLSVVERMRQLRAGSALSLKEIVEKLDRDAARGNAEYTWMQDLANVSGTRRKPKRKGK